MVNIISVRVDDTHYAQVNQQELPGTCTLQSCNDDTFRINGPAAVVRGLLQDIRNRFAVQPIRLLSDQENTQ